MAAGGRKFEYIMNSLESKCKQLLSAINGGDVETYKRLRMSIVADISDNDFMVREYEDNLAVGKALVIVLDDMSRGGIIYKRVVLIAMHSLLKIIINDKNDNNSQTAIASALLLILFSENQNFVGGEYIVSKVRSTETAAHQFIGISCVFYWKYKFNPSKPSLLYRTQQRLQKSISSSTLDTPDALTRKKVVDFEYDNFNSMLHDLPLDVELKYPGVPFFDPEVVYPRIQSMFNAEPMYFKKPEPAPINNERNTTGNSINRPVYNTSQKGSSSGCLGFFILLIVTSVIMAFSI